MIKLKNIFSLKWWNEKTIEVTEHYYDWMAPRWYLLLVGSVYILGFFIIIMLYMDFLKSFS